MGTGSTVEMALVGNPNSGKTSVFNRLTGFNQHVGNFPGVTVDKKSAAIKVGQTRVKLVDLPGAYSLYPNSIDERVVLEVLLGQYQKPPPGGVIYVADASNLERHLLLLSQIIDLGLPVILALNKVDIAEKEGFFIDQKRLEAKLGIPVIKVNGRTGEGLDQVKSWIADLTPRENGAFLDTKNFAPKLIKEIKAKAGIAGDYRALLLAHHHESLNLPPDQKQLLAQLVVGHEFSTIRNQVDEIMKRYEKIQPICLGSLRSGEGRNSLTDRLDKVLTHKFFGTVLFFLILFMIFQAIFSWAVYPMDLIDQGMANLNVLLNETLPSGFLTSLLTDGIISGLGGILIFIPQIAILFGFIALLEEIGYMSRAVYLSDSLMQKFGLNGRSLVSLISGVACAVPAIMATRTISNWKERFITIFITPFISCSARIPVLIVLISFAVPKQYVFGFINIQGLAMLGMYILGATAALFSAYLLKRVLKSTESSFLIMEMPVYQLPHWKNIGISVFEKVKIFVVEAGKIIMIISVILWVLASFGPPDKMLEAEQKALVELQERGLGNDQLDNLVASRKLEASYAGHLGKFLEPAIRPLGFDWKIGIALVTSFAAREVFVSTMATMYSVGSVDDHKTIIERMKEEIDPKTGKPFFSPAVSFSLIVFYILAMQCMSTLAVVKRETKSWLVPMAQLFYMTGLAYLASLLTFNIAS